MKILSIDTTTKVASVAILNDNKITSNSISNEITHSEKLLPIIDKSLTDVNLKISDIDMYAAINGPGSFTGIRIGLATLKAFSMTCGKKIFSMSSIMLLAYKAYIENLDKFNIKNSTNKASESASATHVLTLIDARNDRVYYSLEKLSKNSNEKIEIETVLEISNDLYLDALKTISLKLKDLKIYDNNLIITGNCVNKFESDLTSNFESAILYDTYPTPEDLILAYQNISNFENFVYDTYTLDAVYARASQAERLKNNEN